MNAPAQYFQPPQPTTSNAGYNFSDPAAEDSLAQQAWKWRPANCQNEPPVSTMTRVALRLVDRKTGESYSADELIAEYQQDTYAGIPVNYVAAVAAVGTAAGVTWTDKTGGAGGNGMILNIVDPGFPSQTALLFSIDGVNINVYPCTDDGAKATAASGSSGSAVTWEWPVAGTVGNMKSVDFFNPGTANYAGRCEVIGNVYNVYLPTNSGGAAYKTATQIAADETHFSNFPFTAKNGGSNVPAFGDGGSTMGTGSLGYVSISTAAEIAALTDFPLAATGTTSNVPIIGNGLVTLADGVDATPGTPGKLGRLASYGGLAWFASKDNPTITQDGWVPIEAGANSPAPVIATPATAYTVPLPSSAPAGTKVEYHITSTRGGDLTLETGIVVPDKYAGTFPVTMSAGGKYIVQLTYAFAQWNLTGIEGSFVLPS